MHEQKHDPNRMYAGLCRYIFKEETADQDRVAGQAFWALPASYDAFVSESAGAADIGINSKTCDTQTGGAEKDDHRPWWKILHSRRGQGQCGGWSRSRVRTTDL